MQDTQTQNIVLKIHLRLRQDSAIIINRANLPKLQPLKGRTKK